MTVTDAVFVGEPKSYATHPDLRLVSGGPYLLIEDLAEASKFKVGSLRVFLSRARRNRAKGIHDPMDIPEPTGNLFGLSVWDVETATRWVLARRANTDPSRRPLAELLASAHTGAGNE